MSPHRSLRSAAGLSAALVVSLLSTTGAVDAAEPRAAVDGPLRADPAQVVLDWERTAFTTVYPAKPIPVGVPILGFTSVAMFDAARESLQRGRSSETAAVATAAHDVLLHYIPGASATLHMKLSESLAAVSDFAARTKGSRVGRAAAAEMLASRVGDGFEDPEVHYEKAFAAGVWQPAGTATDMLAAWLGSLDPLVVDTATEVDGPDSITTPEYAADYNEVRDFGRAMDSSRTAEQSDLAVFFNANAVSMFGDAAIRMLEEDPTSLRRTALFFARMHGAMTDSVIRCWQLKRDVGFWRPVEAINATVDDGNSGTETEPGWRSLLGTPPYSDYVSGHGCLTAPAAQTVRMMFGEETELELRWTGTVQPPLQRVRVYENLTRLESEALNSRIWGGLHFRDAMVDAYAIGHDTAVRVADRLR